MSLYESLTTAPSGGGGGGAAGVSSFNGRTGSVTLTGSDVTVALGYTPISTTHDHDYAYYTQGEIDTFLLGKADTGHVHSIANVTNLQTTLDGKAAAAHAHAITDVTSLQATLDGKSNTGHAHAVSDVTGLQTALDGKTAVGHTHAISEVTNLQTSLDGKAASAHAHAISDVTSLQTTLDGKASTSHGHTIGDVSGLQTSLDGKANTVHNHAISDVVNLQTSLDGKAATVHTHAISDVTNLQSSLDGKSAIGHTHEASNISDFSEAVDDRVNALLTAGTNVSFSYNDVSNTLTVNAGPASLPTASLTYVIDGGGSAITTGQKGHIQIPFGCTITEWTLLADQSGSIVIDIWEDTYANFPPTVADTITASAKPTLSSAQKNTSTTLTGWNTTVNAGDIMAFNVDSASTVTRVMLSLKVTKT